MTYITLQRADGSLVGAFAERQVALAVAREVLGADSTLLLQTFDAADRLVREELVYLRQGRLTGQNR